MVAGITCAAAKQDGERCTVAPLRGDTFCFWHSPDHATEAAEARRLGGLRRRREKTVEGAYDYDGLGSVEQIRRLVEIAAVDALGLENSVARGRILIAAAHAATRLLEIGELEERLTNLEDRMVPLDLPAIVTQA